MEKEFIPYEQALALKELGFDEPCLKYVWNDKTHSQYMHNASGNKTYHFQCHFIENKTLFTVSVPTSSQAFRWFRDKHKLHHLDLLCLLYLEQKINYEEAEIECLKRLIEILKNKILSIKNK